jgi:environmental stress-induced protein Ves
VSWQSVELKNLRPVPWKNGGGTTRELVTWPSAEDWVWRVSVAEVAQSGPFSRFPGIDRWFAVLEGDGVALSINGERHSLTSSSVPFHFDGGMATACALLGGATLDFNLMTRRDVAQAHLTRLSGQCKLALSASEIVAIYAVSARPVVRFNAETVNCMPDSLTWRLVNEPASLEVDADHVLVIRIALAAAEESQVTTKAKGRV